jgi:hypothetical protein
MLAGLRRQRVEECARGRVSSKRRGHVVGKIAALRAFGASSTVTSSPIATPVPTLTGSTHPLPPGESLVRPG